MLYTPDERRDFKEKIMRSIVLIIAILFTALNGKGQFIKINEGLLLINKPYAEVSRILSAKSFSYVKTYEEFMTYVKRTQLGDAYLTIAVKANIVKAISWEEHIMYANRIRAEIETKEGFVEEQQRYGTIKVYKNETQNIIVSLITNPNTNTTTITIGNIRNVTKNQFFNGTKKFCDGLGVWYYLVTVNGTAITLKSYPDKGNTYVKDKSKPSEVIKGKIVNGKIVTKDPPEYLINRFKYENGVLYEMNNEGEYNDYRQCK